MKNYGKIPAEEFIEKSASLEESNLPDLERTLREDYEIRTDEDGGFSVTYTCSCHFCKMSFKFEHEEKIPL